MKNLTPEMIEKAKAAKSAEELIALAKDNGVEMTADEAATYFAQLNPKSGELNDDDLDNVSGGSCYAGDGRMIVTLGYVCPEITHPRSGCPNCNTSFTIRDTLNCVYCSTCKRQLYCKDCIYLSYEGGMWFCNNEYNRR